MRPIHPEGYPFTTGYAYPLPLRHRCMRIMEKYLRMHGVKRISDIPEENMVRMMLQIQRCMADYRVNPKCTILERVMVAWRRIEDKTGWEAGFFIAVVLFNAMAVYGLITGLVIKNDLVGMIALAAVGLDAVIIKIYDETHG